MVLWIPVFSDNPPSIATDVTYISARTYDPCKTDISLCELQKFCNVTEYSILSDGKPMVLALNVKDDVPFKGEYMVMSFEADEQLKTTLNSVREHLRKVLNETEERMPQFITRRKDKIDGQVKDFFEVGTRSNGNPCHFIVDRAGQPIESQELDYQVVSLTLFIHFKGVRVFRDRVAVDYEMRQMVVTNEPRDQCLGSAPGIEAEDDIEKLLAFV